MRQSAVLALGERPSELSNRARQRRLSVLQLQFHRKLVAHFEATWLGHPRDAGVNELAVALPGGQVADCALSFDDESRIHAHERLDGRFLVDRKSVV